MIRAITLDLDDTVWPIGPMMVQIETALTAWLVEHAPATATRFADPADAHAVMEAVWRERTDLEHDLGAMRREGLRRMLVAAGDDVALVGPAYEVVLEARQRVEPYPDAIAGLERLADRWPLLALTNGNADLARIGLDHHFVAGTVASAKVGVAKPDPRIFAVACDRLGVRAAEVLHAGDHLHYDVRGALDAGLQAAWVHRDLEGDAPTGVLRARDLLELADLLGA